MPISEYNGPANHVTILRHLVGERVHAAFIDDTGRVWLIVPSGHAVVFAGFDTSSPAYFVAQPADVTAATARRREQLQAKIQELKDLAPGVAL